MQWGGGEGVDSYLDHVVVGAADNKAAVILYAADGGDVSHQDVQALPAPDIPHTQRRVPGTRYNLVS
jgi:hypothetical protein